MLLVLFNSNKPFIIVQTPTTTEALTTTVVVEAPPTLLPVVNLGPTLPTNKSFADTFALRCLFVT